jgi:hypothetical protein
MNVTDLRSNTGPARRKLEFVDSALRRLEPPGNASAHRALVDFMCDEVIRSSADAAEMLRAVLRESDLMAYLANDGRQVG